MARRFVLIRDAHDAVNPPGIVAEGVVFDSSRVAINWTTKPYSTQIFDSLSDLLAIQEHNGVTRIQWVDVEDRGHVQPRSAGVPKLMAARALVQETLSQSGAYPTVSEDSHGVVVVLGRR